MLIVSESIVFIYLHETHSEVVLSKNSNYIRFITGGAIYFSNCINKKQIHTL